VDPGGSLPSGQLTLATQMLEQKALAQQTAGIIGHAP
jgi:hypothetical protein